MGSGVWGGAGEWSLFSHGPRTGRGFRTPRQSLQNEREPNPMFNSNGFFSPFLCNSTRPTILKKRNLRSCIKHGEAPYRNQEDGRDRSPNCEKPFRTAVLSRVATACTWAAGSFVADFLYWLALHISMNTHTCTYLYVYVHVYLYIYIYMFKNRWVHMYIYIYAHTHTYICMYMYIHMYIHMHICIHLFSYAYVCLRHLYIYIYSFRQTRAA